MQRNLECLDVGTGDPTRLRLPTAHREQLVPGALEHYDYEIWELLDSRKEKPEGSLYIRPPLKLETISSRPWLQCDTLSESKIEGRNRIKNLMILAAATFLSMNTGGFCKTAPPARITCMPSCRFANIPIKKMKRRN